MGAIQIPDLNNGKTDVDFIAEFVNSTAAVAIDRFGRSRRTLKGVDVVLDERVAVVGQASEEAVATVEETRSAAVLAIDGKVSNVEGVVVAAVEAAVGVTAESAASVQANRVAYEDRVYPGVYSTPPGFRPHSGEPSAAGDRCTILVAGVPYEHLRTGGAWIIPNVDAATLAMPNGAAIGGFTGAETQSILDNAVPMQSYAAMLAYSGRARGIRITTSGISGPFSYNTLAPNTTDGGTFFAHSSGIGRWERLFEGAVYATWFGVVYGGAADEASKLQAALNTGFDVVVEGVCRIASKATVENHGPQTLIFTEGAQLSVQLASGTDLFDFKGPVWLQDPDLDFNGMGCRYGIRYAANVGHIRIRNIRLHNLMDIDSTSGTILVWIPPTGNTFDIDVVRASSLLKRGNGSITDSAGSLNVIYVGGGPGGTQGSINNSKFDDIHNINALNEVIYEDTAGIYIATDSTDAKNRISIDGVSGSEFGKRVLKIHASNVSVNDVTGISEEGDSLGVVTFLSGEGLGEKAGCSASNIRSTGKMEIAVSSTARGTKYKNIISHTQPGTKPGMVAGLSAGLQINGDDTEVDGYESSSNRWIVFGSTTRIVKNTKMKNLKMKVLPTTTAGLQNVFGTLGFDGLTIEGIDIEREAGAPSGIAPLALDLYLNGTTVKGKNLKVSGITFSSADAGVAYGLSFKYIETISLDTFRYRNTSGAIHYRLAMFEFCSNVKVDGVDIEGANQVGVWLKDCTGRNTVSRVTNPGSTVADVYNQNSSNMQVNDCEPGKVAGITTATPQNPKWTVQNTANRPTTGLVAGLSQHFDTTLNKPIWWNGSVWKDASGATV